MMTLIKMLMSTVYLSAMVQSESVPADPSTTCTKFSRGGCLTSKNSTLPSWTSRSRLDCAVQCALCKPCVIVSFNTGECQHHSLDPKILVTSAINRNECLTKYRPDSNNTINDQARGSTLQVSQVKGVVGPDNLQKGLWPNDTQPEGNDDQHFQVKTKARRNSNKVKQSKWFKRHFAQAERLRDQYAREHKGHANDTEGRARVMESFSRGKFKRQRNHGGSLRNMKNKNRGSMDQREKAKKFRNLGSQVKSFRNNDHERGSKFLEYQDKYRNRGNQNKKYRNQGNKNDNYRNRGNQYKNYRYRENQDEDNRNRGNQGNNYLNRGNQDKNYRNRGNQFKKSRNVGDQFSGYKDRAYQARVIKDEDDQQRALKNGRGQVDKSRHKSNELGGFKSQDKRTASPEGVKKAVDVLVNGGWGQTFSKLFG